ncbi:MAG: RdgB/HAM1 family non-canonical purine NTP pyrophosphatase [Woeseiaceae bacterium]|nr:RdgB/HAM1 family non-canonical purine NTP pyrophosphatase [Woeseiaceae bacterium]
MSLPSKIVAATSNPGKIREFNRLLTEFGIEVVPQSAFDVPDADETGTTFEANSLIKARHAAELTGMPAIADDSGIAVDALDGRPGVYSARYAGPGATDEANVDKLLDEMQGVSDRAAAFHCVVTFVADPQAEPIAAEGIWHGHILEERRGSGGFGYDPVFLDPESGVASAELSQDEKNARSHRGKALRELARRLRELSSQG